VTRAIVVLCLFSLAAAAPVSPGYAAYEKANKLFVARKFTETAAALDEALRLDPKLVPALTLKAKLEMANNHFEDARHTLERALSIDPNAEYALFLYGLEAYVSNEMAQALPRFRKAHRLSPSNPRAALYLGLTCEALGETTEAMSLYREAVRLEQARGRVDAETLLPGARLLFLQDHLEESERWTRQAIKAARDFRDAHFQLARVLLKKGDAAGAAAEGVTALRLPGVAITDVQIHYLLIRAFRESGQPEKSATHAEILRSLETH
jgi:tetratricopeptide (TPR) repeat protein